MRVFKQRGGAQVGWVNASWPLAGIEVAPGKLTIRSMGTYAFAPGDVSAIEEVGAIPFFSQGIRVHHRNDRYPEKIVFHTLSGRPALLAAIREAGFPLGQPTTQVKRGFPMRLPALVAVIATWNLLFFFDGPVLERAGRLPGPFVILALAMLFMLATLLPRSTRLQSLFMRDGRDVGEIASTLRLVQLVSGLMTLGFGLSYLTQ